MNKEIIQQEPRCEFCRDKSETLYEAWFYTSVRNNPYAKGTASAGLIQLRVSCKECFNELNKQQLTVRKNPIV